MKKEAWLARDECTGCGACENICPANVLAIEEDETGHLYPKASEGCTGCNLCEKVCRKRLRLVGSGMDSPKVYAAWTKDDALRFSSTSGAAFTELSRAVLSRSGVIFGAAYEDGCVVCHTDASTELDLAKLRQSKYVQSRMGKAFRAVKRNLESGKEVLFCGAPCQIAGLRAYLGKEYKGLYLVDFVCQGVNSPKAFASWIKGLENLKGEKVSRVWFKYKVGGWKTSPKRTRIDFENGDYMVQDGDDNHYMCGYLDTCLYLRPSCSSCEFKGFPRQGDLTVADFWGLDQAFDDDKGASLVMVSTIKGERLFMEAKRNMMVFERRFEEIFTGNKRIYSSASVGKNSEAFLRALDQMDFESAYKRFGKLPILKRIRRKAGKAKRLLSRESLS